VGPEHTISTIHADLLANQSKALEKLVHGKMAEAQEGTAVFEDVTVDTFARFSQYMYTGDYTAHKSNHTSDVPPPPPPPPPPPVEADDLDMEPVYWEDTIASSRIGRRKKSVKGKKYDCEYCLMPTSASKRTKAWEAFQSRSYPRPSTGPHVSDTNIDLDKDTPFLCHAQLYVLADKYDIEELRCLSLSKLHFSLCAYGMDHSPVEDVVTLLEYTFCNTPDRQECTDGLRSLVIDYVACIVEQLCRNSSFESLLEEKGEIGRALVHQLLSRLDI
jgi:hypothetical protein